MRLSKRKRQMFTTFELLGKDLFTLSNDARKSGHNRFAADAIKKVAKDVLSALKFLHAIKICESRTVHRDVKKCNIAMVVSTKGLCQELEMFFGSSATSLDHLRMVCQRKYAMNNVDEVKANIQSWLKELNTADPPEDAPKFKLIDLESCTVSFIF